MNETTEFKDPVVKDSDLKDSVFAQTVIWLTGASSGIGEALARRLAKEPCILALTARNEEALLDLQSNLAGTAAQVLVYAGDVTDSDRMKNIAAEIEQSVGPVAILVANAGTHIPTDVTQFDSTQYSTLMNINYTGSLNCIEAVLPSMLTRKSGYLAVVSSVAGYRGLPRAAAYGASKAALSHFLESIRFDLEPHGIAVSVISPGFVETPLTDKNDFTMPFLIKSEVAAERIFQGLVDRNMEIHFPRRFTYIVKFLRLLPYPLYHAIIKRIVLR